MKGEGMEITTGTKMLGMKEDATCYMKDIGLEEGKRLIEKYKLNVPAELIEAEHTDMIVAYDKMGGVEGVLFILPYSSEDAMVFTLNDGVILPVQRNHVLLLAYC